MLKNKKTKNEVLNQRAYFISPEIILTNTQLTPFEKLIFFYLLNKEQSWNPSTRNLSENLGLSRGVVQRSLRNLEKYNLIKILSTKMNCKILVNSCEDWNLIANPLAYAPGPSGEPRLAPERGQSGPSGEPRLALLESLPKENRRLKRSRETENSVDLFEEEEIPLIADLEPEEFALPENQKLLEELQEIDHSSNKYLS